MRCTLPRPFELKGLDEDGRFAGYASVFGVSDSYADVVVEGAFARSLAESRASGQMPAMLWQHDPSRPIGVWTDLKEDRAGLKVHGKLAIGTQAGREAYELLRLGAINGLSIGYVTVASEIEPRRRQRVLTDLELWEISLVTFPANPDARVTNVKTSPAQVRWGGGEAALAAVLRGVRSRTLQISQILKGN